MGREVKKVPLDFDWPINMIWKGYMNPYRPIDCTLCDGSGLNKEMKKLSDDWYTHLRTDGQKGWSGSLDQKDVQALIDAGRLMDFTRVALTAEHRDIIKKKIAAGGNSWLPFDNGYIPTASEVNEWSHGGLRHDAINQSICVEARAERLGINGNCFLCNGYGHYWADSKYEELWNDWERIEPPEGKGWQMWENVSEGSPMSPIFKTPEELAYWLADSSASAMGNKGATYEQWLAMINQGSCLTMIAKINKEGVVVQSGVEAANNG